MTQTPTTSGRLRLLLIAAFVLLAVGAGSWLYKSRTSSNVQYRQIPVRKGDIDVAILATGTVQPENRLEIKPPIAGRVEQVLVKEGQAVRRGQILAWMSSTERAALIDAARSKGADELKKWEELYRPTPVLAPIPGTIILRNVESGQTFTSSDPIFVMSDRLTVKAQVDETDIAKIKLKQPAEIVLDAYPDQRIEGRVDQIAFEAKTVNNVTNYAVDVLPIETPDFMRSGMTANVRFLVDSKKGVLVVPSDAVRSENGAQVVLVQPSGKPGPEPRQVQTGLTDGKRTEIVSGLAEGELVSQAQLKPKERKSQGSSPFSPMGGNRSRGGGR